MSRILRKFISVAAFLLALAAVPANAHDDYPNRRVTIVVPIGPGSVLDNLVRLLADRMSQELGQPVVIDNRSGASGIIGYNVVARSRPDGYTLAAAVAAFAVNRHLFKNIPYDELKDFIPIATIARTPMTIVVSANAPVSTLKEYQALVASKPKAYNYAITNGGQLLNSELIRQRLGLDMVSVPYAEFGPAIQDVIAGRTLSMLIPVNNALPLVAGKTIKPLAMMCAERTAVLPDIPSASEQGVEGLDMWSWQGILAPAGTPEPVVAKLNALISKISNEPAFKERLQKAGFQPYSLSSGQFADLIRSEIEAFGEIARKLNIEPQ